MASSNQSSHVSGFTGAPQISLEPVVVNYEVCRNLAELLQRHNIPADREDSSLQWMSPLEIGNFYLLLVAICHQTSPRGQPPFEGEIEGRRLRGWDFLSAKLQAAVRVNPKILSPAFWACMVPEQVVELFRDEKFGDRLTDPHGRAFLIRDLGQKMLAHSWDYADQLYRHAKGRIATGSNSLLDLLSQFRAYDDPVRKKSFFFLALMHNSGLWTYVDPEQLGAPVDYHEVRGHLRIGSVEIRDPELRTAIMEGRDVTANQDIAIRLAVHKALMFISEMSGLRNPSQIHYLFWNVFRACCTRENPHCRNCPPNCALPARYVPLGVAANGARRCPFAAICQSVDQEAKLIEHSIQTDYF